MAKLKKEKIHPIKAQWKYAKNNEEKCIFCILLRENLAVYCKTVAIRPVNM